MNAHDDIRVFMERLRSLPTNWDGKKSVLELKAADYQWRQMEWWAFYFEYKAGLLLEDVCERPGEKFERVEFDLKRAINWDLKAKAIKSDDHKVILNDVFAMRESIARHGAHGEIIALCDVEYNDQDRGFQKWHNELKGGPSKYELERKQRTSVSRYRKTRARLTEVLFVIIEGGDLARLGEMKQGRNANGAPRPPKYMLDLESLNGSGLHKLEF